MIPSCDSAPQIVCAKVDSLGSETIECNVEYTEVKFLIYIFIVLLLMGALNLGRLIYKWGAYSTIKLSMNRRYRPQQRLTLFDRGSDSDPEPVSAPP